MAGPLATCYKRQGTKAWFYSKKGAWNTIGVSLAVECSEHVTQGRALA